MVMINAYLKIFLVSWNVNKDGRIKIRNHYIYENLGHAIYLIVIYDKTASAGEKKVLAPLPSWPTLQQPLKFWLYQSFRIFRVIMNQTRNREQDIYKNHFNAIPLEPVKVLLDNINYIR